MSEDEDQDLPEGVDGGSGTVEDPYYTLDPYGNRNYWSPNLPPPPPPP